MPALLLTVVCLWRCMQRLQRSRPWLRLDRDGLYSPWLHGSRKHLRWQDIGRIRLDPQQRCLTFAAHARPGPRLDGLSKEDLDAFRMAQDRFPLPAPVTGHNLSLGALSRDDVALLQLALQRHQPGLDFRGQSDRFPPGQETVPPRTGVSTSLMLMLLFILVAAVGAGAGLDGSMPEQLLDWGASTGYDIQHGAWWRLFSATLLHSDFIQLCISLAGLAMFAIKAERLYGRWRVLLLYSGSALGSQLLAMRVAAPHTVLVGAAGAILGLAAAVAIARLLRKPRSMWPLPGMGLFVLLIIFTAWRHSTIDHEAHLAGLLGGVLGGVLLAPLLLPRPAMANWQHVVGPLAIAIMVSTVSTQRLALPPQQDPRTAIAHIRHQQQLLQQLALQLQKLGRQQLRQLQEIEQDGQDMMRGKISWLEQARRENSIHIPAFAAMSRELSAIVPPPHDHPLYDRWQDQKRLLQLGTEWLTGHATTSPARLLAIQQELQAIIQREQLRIRAEQ